MNDNRQTRDYSSTLNLPETDFPMRASLPQKEPEILAEWKKVGLYKKLRKQSKGRKKYILHDGPPYANGHLHIGHALNKILKDIINRSFQMRGFDANYVPGWDCHGLPIEWKIEELYRERGQDKNEVPINDFRRECREFANHWIGVQALEFRRLGVEGDFETPYKTMDFRSEAAIAAELHGFAMSGQLYRGSKPVMWSVVERTVLAEAEIEYRKMESDTIRVKFPIRTTMANSDKPELNGLQDACMVIWTTTPWTIPGNRAISFSGKINYALYEVQAAENNFGPQPGEKLIFAESLAEENFSKARLESIKLRSVSADELAGIVCNHPLKDFVDGYNFAIPLLDGDHVTDETGTGFVHTAPGHGREDFDVWMENKTKLETKGISSRIPFTVDDAGYFTSEAPGFGPERENGACRILDDKGKKGNANQCVITALIEENALFERARLRHDYPHSWRSKKPVIFRNTPQWFIRMDGKDDSSGNTLRSLALKAITETGFVPASGRNRLSAMIKTRPDWVLSRQRAWGVPIAIFSDREGNILKDETVNRRIVTAFEREGADAWFAKGAKELFLNGEHDASKWHLTMDILDVWFDSGSTHVFCLEQRKDLQWPADLYLEGSDQHRGWFHSSLLESCGSRGRAPYKTVLTHGFTMAEDGRKMSKSSGNIVTPREIINQYGADILRLWTASIDYSEDQRIGREIIKTAVDAYRKMRNTLRWMLGSLSHDKKEKIALNDMPELEHLMLHRLFELDRIVRDGYDTFDFKRIFSQLSNFMTVELSAFYFDIRKDALYCDATSSVRRKAAVQIVAVLFDTIIKWMAPILPFTMEECWLSRNKNANSIHMEQFNKIPEEWENRALADKWQKIRRVRRVVTGALEIERKEKRIGSSLEAAPVVYINDNELIAALEGQNFAEICITSQIEIKSGNAPKNAFSMEEINNVGVIPALAQGNKCARSWRVLPEVGSDSDYPDLSLRDADAMRELETTLPSSSACL